MDIEKICRTCLSLSGPFLTIFDGGSGGGTSCIADMICDFTKTKPKPADNLPEKVCLTCISEINRSYSFKQKVEHSNRTLRQLLPDAKPEEPDQPVLAAVPSPVPKVDKYAQTTPLQTKKTCSREIQTIDDQRTIESDITVLVSKKDAATSPINNLKIVNVSPKKNKSKAHDKPNDKTTPVKFILDDEDEAHFIEITAELDNADNESIEINELTLNENKNIVLHVDKGEGKYTEMIFDESTGELRSQDEQLLASIAEETEQNDPKVDSTDSKNVNEYKFTIYNNENGEEEISASAITTRKTRANKRKQAFVVPKEPTTLKSKPRVKRVAPETINELTDEEPKKRRQTVNKNNVLVSTNENDAPTLDGDPESKDDGSAVTKLNYFCERCGAGFAIRKSLLIHQRQSNCLKQSFKCDVCARVFVSSEHLSEHQVTHENELHACAECTESFDTKEALSAHMIESHKRSSKNQCNVCQKVFTMLSALRDHMRIHTGEKPFVCHICKKGFTQNANLRQHMFRHSNTKRFKCDECESSFVTRGELVSHNRSHTGDKPFHCDVCDVKFTTSSSLIKHKRKHTGERPYACEMCPMRFTALNVLKNHRRTHTGEKPFACPHCPRRFTQNGDCVMHQRTHQEQEKIYLCPVCNKEFKSMPDMRTHLKEHSDKDKSLTAVLARQQRNNKEDETLSI